MKILYLAQRLPYPPNRGDRIPTFNHIRHLSRHHEMHVASLLESDAEMEHVAKLSDWAASVTVRVQDRWRRLAGMAVALLLGRPLSLGHFRNGRFAADIQRLIRDRGIQAVVVFSSSMAQYVEKNPELVRVMNFCDMDSQKWKDMAVQAGFPKRWIYRREARLLLDYERAIAGSFTSCCVVTENEAKVFRELIPAGGVSVVANGVDVAHFAEKPRRPSACELAFVGVMDYGPNIEAVIFFVEKIWPQVRRRYPEAGFNIVGARPTREVKALSQTAGVTVTGFVPDVRDYLASATLVVVPLEIARGIQNKILEAMAAGVPVLTTPVAAKGLPAGARETLFVEARDQAAFADALLRLLADPAAMEPKAAAAQAFVRMHCSWEANVAILERLILGAEPKV
jgi:sugar transferase (PEP-CTERM/EpsH1 system associated)